MFNSTINKILDDLNKEEIEDEKTAERHIEEIVKDNMAEFKEMDIEMEKMNIPLDISKMIYKYTYDEKECKCKFCKFFYMYIRDERDVYFLNHCFKPDYINLMKEERRFIKRKIEEEHMRKQTQEEFKRIRDAIIKED